MHIIIVVVVIVAVVAAAAVVYEFVQRYTYYTTHKRIYTRIFGIYSKCEVI